MKGQGLSVHLFPLGHKEPFWGGLGDPIGFLPGLLIEGDLPRAFEVRPWDTLLDVLWDQLGLIVTKEGCGIRECGACTVLMDGKPINSRLILAAEAEGHEITTIEGLSPKGHFHPFQKAFLERGTFQCGFCTRV